MTVTVTPMENGFGGEDRDAVYGAFLDHHLIIIRGQALNAEQVTAARILAMNWRQPSPAPFGAPPPAAAQYSRNLPE